MLNSGALLLRTKEALAQLHGWGLLTFMGMHEKVLDAVIAMVHLRTAWINARLHVSAHPLDPATNPNTFYEEAEVKALMKFLDEKGIKVQPPSEY